MIYSMASDLATRQTVWIGRNPSTDRQFFYNDTPVVVETAWLAGVHGERFSDEVSLPSW